MKEDADCFSESDRLGLFGRIFLHNVVIKQGGLKTFYLPAAMQK